MNPSLDITARRRAPRVAALRRAQGNAARGAIVAAGLVAAVALQLVGPRLQCRLADLVGAPSAAPAPAPAPMPMPSCGTPSSDANPMHPCKVATMASAAPIVAPGI